MIFLQTEQLCKNFGGLAATKNVDFAMNDKEIHALIGPNGAGKSTFVGLLSGRIHPDSGFIIFNDRDITNEPAYKRVGLGIGYSFQITSIYKNLSVFDNIAIGVQRQMDNTKERGAKILNQRTNIIIDKIGLGKESGQLAGLLSYGHQRLCEIGMALALNPKLLICDEPTQGLHDSEIREFINLLRVEKANRGILIIDHNMDVVMEIADRITVLNLGEKLASDTPHNIKHNPAVMEAYLHG